MTEKLLKTISIVLHPLRRQNDFLLKKAESIPKELLPTYQRGQYPEGSSKIINNVINKMWKTLRSNKQISLRKQDSKIVKISGCMFFKFQTELIPFRLKEIEKFDELLLNNYNSAVVWLRGDKWVADVQVEIDKKYIEGNPEAVIGIDLGKFHACYSIFIHNKEIYRAYDSFGEYHKIFEKIGDEIAKIQSNFDGTRQQLSSAVSENYKKISILLRQYYGTLRNKILGHIPQGYNAVFVLEDLDGLLRIPLNKKMRKWVHQELAYGIFSRQIEWNGYKLVKVNPRGTTHTCWKCGKPVESNSKRQIICQTCYPRGLDRDLNGARNIAKRYMLLASHNVLVMGKPINLIEPCAIKVESK